MDVKIQGGYLIAELSQHDCQLLDLACRAARRSADQPDDHPRHQLENLSTIFTLSALLISAHVNMCPQDMTHHLEHLTQPTPGLNLSPHIL